MMRLPRACVKSPRGVALDMADGLRYNGGGSDPLTWTRWTTASTVTGGGEESLVIV